MSDEMPTTINSLDEAQVPLRPFFKKDPDGTTYSLRLKGEPHGYVREEKLAEATAKLAEFRDGNRGLNSKVTDLETRLKAFDGIDPEAAKTALAKAADTTRDDALELAASLQTQLATTKNELRDLHIRHIVDSAFIAAGGVADASPMVLDRAKAAGYTLGADGQLTTTLPSVANPGVPMPVAEWLGQQMSTSSYLFKPSRGAGVPPRDSGQPPAAKPTIDKNDAVAFGKNVEAIASGAMGVR